MCREKRSQWIETISGANAEHQIYLDEAVLIQPHKTLCTCSTWEMCH